MVKKKKKVWLWGSLVLIAVLAVWISSRWNAWFHNPEELPYTPLAVPHRVLLTFGDDSELSRDVSWQCDTVLYPSHLELRSLTDSTTQMVEAKGEVFRSRQGQAAFYVARLRNLKPGQHYVYRVVTDGKASSWYDFHTYPEHRDEVEFLYVGDVQDTLGGMANQIMRQALQRHPQCEFLVCGGDFVERPTNQHWDIAFNDIDSIAQHIPMLCVTGNHDYLKGIIMQLERRFTLTFPYFLDSKIGDNHVYALCYGPIQFFLLDSNRELPHLVTQRSWLKEQLEKSKAKWKIVVLHHPLYSIRGKNNNLIQRYMFDDLIQDYHVDLVLQGHEHAYGRMTLTSDDSQFTTLYTISHCSPKNYRISDSAEERFEKIGAEGRYYQTVSVKGDTLTMVAYEASQHTRFDSLAVIKKDNCPQ